MYVQMEAKRSNVTYRIDDRVIDSIKSLAHSRGQSANNYVEMHFIRHFQEIGIFSEDFSLIGEARGRKPDEKIQTDGKRAYKLLAERFERSLTEEEAIFVIKALPEYNLTLEKLIEQKG